MITEGILNINKPQNMTSHDVVRDLRRVFGVKRIGHTGTLDPMATGVLPVCVGSAARVTEYLDLDLKQYKCTMKLGVITDTQDIWGKVIENRPVEEKIDERTIESAFNSFHGIIDQKPPMYSAVRVNGRRLYDYARAGEEVDVKTRRIFIKNLKVDGIDLNDKTVMFNVECSKGTYIRTICQDVGEILGCGATMTELVRTASGCFAIENSIPLDEVKKMTAQEAGKLLMPVDTPLSHFGKAVISKELGKKFVDGWHTRIEDCKILRHPEFERENPPFQIRPEYKKAYNIYMEDAENPQKEIFLGVAFYNSNYKKLVADKVFFRGKKDEDI